jgi:hypothetical protein
MMRVRRFRSPGESVLRPYPDKNVAITKIAEIWIQSDIAKIPFEKEECCKSEVFVR